MNTEKFEEFISQYPIFEYRILDTKDITIQERVRTICQEECERYDSTWACPPAVGTLQECEKKIKSYPQAVFFSSVAEVSDIMNMEEMLSTRRAHEDLTTEVGKYLNKEGYCEINSSNFSVFIVFFFLLGLLVHSFIYDRVRDS